MARSPLSTQVELSSRYGTWVGRPPRDAHSPCLRPGTLDSIDCSNQALRERKPHPGVVHQAVGITFASTSSNSHADSSGVTRSVRANSSRHFSRPDAPFNPHALKAAAPTAPPETPEIEKVCVSNVGLVVASFWSTAAVQAAARMPPPSVETKYTGIGPPPASGLLAEDSQSGPACSRQSPTSQRAIANGSDCRPNVVGVACACDRSNGLRDEAKWSPATMIAATTAASSSHRPAMRVRES